MQCIVINPEVFRFYGIERFSIMNLCPITVVVIR